MRMPPYSFPTVSLPGPVTAIKKEIRRRIILNVYEKGKRNGIWTWKRDNILRDDETDEIKHDDYDE